MRHHYLDEDDRRLRTVEHDDDTAAALVIEICHIALPPLNQELPMQMNLDKDSCENGSSMRLDME